MCTPVQVCGAVHAGVHKELFVSILSRTQRRRKTNSENWELQNRKIAIWNF
jgi:hypothetical protein